MAEKKRAWIATPGCLIIVALLVLTGYGLYIFLRPANSTTVGEVSGKLTEHDSFIDFNPNVDVDLEMHGSGCWTAIAVLATLIILILTAIAVVPRLKARRDRKRAAKEELALKLQSLAKLQR